MKKIACLSLFFLVNSAGAVNSAHSQNTQDMDATILKAQAALQSRNDYKAWDDAIHLLNVYIPLLAKDKLGIKDALLLNSLKTINDVSVQAIKALNYAQNVKGTGKKEIAPKVYGEYEAIISSLNKVMNSLQKGIFILTQKKEARYLLLLTAQSLRSVIEKAQSSWYFL